jgi:hypothetical protein
LKKSPFVFLFVIKTVTFEETLANSPITTINNLIYTEFFSL